MALIGISLYAEEVNALSDIVVGVPSALSLSLYARALTGEMGKKMPTRLMYGVSDIHFDPYPIRSSRNYTYSGEQRTIFDNERISGRFKMVFDMPDVTNKDLFTLVELAKSLPFLGGRVVFGEGVEAAELTEKNLHEFMQNTYISTDHTPFARNILKDISIHYEEPVDMRDLFRAVAWRKYWQRPDAEVLMKKMVEKELSGIPFPKDHPLTQWVDTYPENLVFLPVGYRQLGKPMMHRKEMRETMEEMPHVYAETVYGVHAWERSKKAGVGIDHWWQIMQPESGSIFYAVGRVVSL